MYDDDVIAVRFRYQLILIQMGMLIGLARLSQGHIACEIAIPEITNVDCHDVVDYLGRRTVLKR